MLELIWSIEYYATEGAFVSPKWSPFLRGLFVKPYTLSVFALMYVYIYDTVKGGQI